MERFLDKPAIHVRVCRGIHSQLSIVEGHEEQMIPLISPFHPTVVRGLHAKDSNSDQAGINPAVKRTFRSKRAL